MRNLILTALLILGLSGLCFAATPVNTGKITQSFQKALNGLQPAISSVVPQVEASYPVVITGIEISSGATVEQVELYDYSGSAPGALTSATPAVTNVVFEGSSAANTSTYFDFSQSPIRTQYGLEAAFATTNGVVVYTVQYP